MKITTKGRYAIAIMLYLANNYEKGEFLSLKEIAEEENLSQKYLEKIMMSLKEKDFFISQRGQEGGYKLKYHPSHYTLASILETAEKEIEPVSCVKEEYNCEKKAICKTYPIWKDLNNAMNEYLTNKTLADYTEGNEKNG